MFKDIVGNINTNKMFNIWRFSKNHTYRLVSDTTIEIKDKKLIETSKKISKYGISNLFLIQEAGKKVDKEIRKQGLDKEYDAWVISYISNYKNNMSVFVDLFKQDKWWHKLLYLIRRTCVVTK